MIAVQSAAPVAQAASGVVNLVLRITLLEDLHIGTGLGGGEIDATNCRDSSDKPVIPWTHLKGVLRQSAESLLAMGAVCESDIATLFGWNSYSSNVDWANGKGQAIIGTGVFPGPATGRTFVEWTSTARKKESRKPLEDTKRTEEFIAAGCKFESLCEVPRDLEKCFRKIVDATARLGADRSRGSGLVHIRVDEPENKNAPTFEVPERRNNDGLCLRLHLTNPNEPLCFPKSPVAGNIIESETHIPGSALFGAMVKALHTRGQKDIAERMLAQRDVLVGNGYPVPSGIFPKARLEEISVLPAPLSYRKKKASAATVDFPDWAEPAGSLPKWVPDEVADSLAADEKEKPEPEDKRLDDSAYIFQTASGEPWQLFNPRVIQRMRIRVPDTGKQDDQALFTAEQVPEGSNFVSDVCFKSPEAAERFANALRIVCRQSSRLRIGRAGRPIQIEGAEWIVQSSAPLRDDAQELRIVLESDLILRGPKLGFITRLDGLAIRQLIGDMGGISGVKEECVDDLITVRGFNGSSRLPRAPAFALRRGSVLRLSNVPGESANWLAASITGKQAFGERTHEGYGRVRILSGKSEPIVLTRRLKANNAVKPGTQDEAARSNAGSLPPESDDELAKKACELIDDPRSDIRRMMEGLSKTAVQSLAVIAKGAPADRFLRGLEFQLTHLHMRATKDSDKSKFNVTGVIDQIRNGHDPERAKKLLQLACRWALAKHTHKKDN